MKEETKPTLEKIKDYLPFIAPLINFFQNLIPSAEERIKRREMRSLIKAIERYNKTGELPEGRTIEDLENRLDELMQSSDE